MSKKPMKKFIIIGFILLVVTSALYFKYFLRSSNQYTFEKNSDDSTLYLVAKTRKFLSFKNRYSISFIPVWESQLTELNVYRRSKNSAQNKWIRCKVDCSQIKNLYGFGEDGFEIGLSDEIVQWTTGENTSYYGSNFNIPEIMGKYVGSSHFFQESLVQLNYRPYNEDNNIFKIYCEVSAPYEFPK
jgi:hypothetical protein